jgi:hypothetical protein
MLKPRTKVKTKKKVQTKKKSSCQAIQGCFQPFSIKSRYKFALRLRKLFPCDDLPLGAKFTLA